MASAASDSVTGGDGVSLVSSRGSGTASGITSWSPSRPADPGGGSGHLEIGGVVLVRGPADGKQRGRLAVDDGVEGQPRSGRPADRVHLELRRQRARVAGV